MPTVIQHLNCNLMELKFAGNTDGEEGATETKEMQFTGYGAVFGNVDSYGDAIQKGAFKETIKEAKKSSIWPSLLLQHGGWSGTSEDMTPIGIISSLEEDEIGLKMDAVLADIQRGRDAYTLMKMTPRPAINGLSIGYIPVEWKRNDNPKLGEAYRTLTKIKLMEVSLVTFPANTEARVLSVKSGLDIKIAERALCDAGFSRSESKAILAHGFKSIGLCDAVPLDELINQVKRNIALLSTN